MGNIEGSYGEGKLGGEVGGVGGREGGGGGCREGGGRGVRKRRLCG